MQSAGWLSQDAAVPVAMSSPSVEPEEAPRRRDFAGPALCLDGACLGAGASGD